MRDDAPSPPPPVRRSVSFNLFILSYHTNSYHHIAQHNTHMHARLPRLSSGAVRVMVGVRMCVCMNILRLRTKTKTRDMRYPSSSSSYLVYPSSSYPSSLRSPHLNPFSPVFPAFLPTSLSPLVIFLTSSLGLRLRGQP